MGVVASFEKEEIDGSAIQSTDLKLIVAALDPALVASGFDPALVVRATVASKVYGAKYVEPIEPGSEPIIYIYRLRKDGT
jgi:hypothetical protein